MNSKPYLPPEWAEQAAVMLTWPHDQGDWRPYLKEVEPVFVDIAKAISRFQQVLITCLNVRHRYHVAKLLDANQAKMEHILFACAPSNDTWVRDHGPITIERDGQMELLDFVFNGWGNKFDARLDNAISKTLHQGGVFGHHPMTQVDLVLEGGSLDVDGVGTLLTTSLCLLSPERNPQLNRSQVEATLQRTLGIGRVLWLEHGYLAGDDTDSHIDTLARFCDERTICYVACDDPQDEHYVELKAMETELQALTDLQGNPYRLQPLPWPAGKYDEDGKRLPASYANFLIINRAVLVPTYEDEQDTLALSRIAECFPDREIIAVPCLPLIKQYGSLHCVTMQLPAGIALQSGECL